MENNELKHSGIKGMKWGVRRYQNKDGSLTPAGKKRYADNGADSNRVTVSRTFSRDIYRHGKKVHSKGDLAEVSGIGVRTRIKFGDKTDSKEVKAQADVGRKWVDTLIKGVQVSRTFSRDMYRHGKKVHSKGDPADHSGLGVNTKFRFKKD